MSRINMSLHEKIVNLEMKTVTDSEKSKLFQVGS